MREWDQFLYGLLHDLLQRSGVLLNRLAAIPEDADISHHLDMAKDFAETVRRETAALLTDPGLGHATLIADQLRALQNLEFDIRLVEERLLLFLERFGSHDRRLTRFCRRLMQQVNWPLVDPLSDPLFAETLVVAASTEYYWTQLEFGLICVSPTEGSTLLGLPDLCHELGHILLTHHKHALTGDFEKRVFAHFYFEGRRIESNRLPSEDPELITLLVDQWSDSWLIEFVSDMVATFLAGPAFGWQHIRLCSGRGQEAYHPALGEVATHPADEARLRGVIAVLNEMGAPEEGSRLQALWDDYLRVTREARPAEYDRCYPERLLQVLAKEVIVGCRFLRLRGFDDHAGAADSVITLLQEAWKRFLTESETYGTWERPTLEALWLDLGMPPDAGAV